MKEYSIGVYFLPIILSNDKLHPPFPHLESALVLVEGEKNCVCMILKISGITKERPPFAILHCAGSSVYL